MFKTVQGKLHDKAGNRTPRRDKEITYCHPFSAQTKEEKYYIVKILFMVSGEWGAPCWALKVPHPPSANPTVMLSLSPDGVPSLPNRFAGVGTCPTPAPGCSSMLGVWNIRTEIRREGRPAPLHPVPKKPRWRLLLAGGRSSDVWSSSIFFLVSFYFVSFPFLLKHKWLREVQGMEDLNLLIRLKKKKEKCYHRLPQSCPNSLFWIETFTRILKINIIIIFQPTENSFQILWEKSRQLNWRFWFSADEKGKTLNQSNRTCLGGKSVLVLFPFGNMTGSGHNACGNYNKINFQLGHEALNIVTVWICGLWP